jgi:hypothetical protein
MSRRAGWLIAAAVVVVIAVLAGAGVVAWQSSQGPDGPPVVNVLPIVDRGIADTITAAGTQAAVAVAPVTQVGQCSLGGHKGAQYARAADLYTDPGQEGAVISRIEGGLPADLSPHREAAVGTNAAPLLADLGNGVQLSVRQLGDGWVIARAETTCHPAAKLPVSRSSPAPDVSTSLTALLARLSTNPQTWRVDAVPCDPALNTAGQGLTSTFPSATTPTPSAAESGGTGQIVTTVVISQPTDSGKLSTRLLAALPSGAREFLTDSANRWAYRAGATSVVAAASDDSTLVTVRYTTTC